MVTESIARSVQERPAIPPVLAESTDGDGVWFLCSVFRSAAAHLPPRHHHRCDSPRCWLLYTANDVFGRWPVIGALAVAWLGKNKRMGRILLILLMLFGTDIVGFGLSRCICLSAWILFIGGSLFVMCSSLSISMAQLLAPRNSAEERFQSIWPRPWEAHRSESREWMAAEALKGAKGFALWPLSQAPRSCFGKDSTANLELRGYRMLVKNKKEPWGQTVSRIISPEGLLVGVTFTPLMRGKEKR